MTRRSRLGHLGHLGHLAGGHCRHHRRRRRRPAICTVSICFRDLLQLVAFFCSFKWKFCIYLRSTIRLPTQIGILASKDIRVLEPLCVVRSRSYSAPNKYLSLQIVLVGCRRRHRRHRRRRRRRRRFGSSHKCRSTSAAAEQNREWASKVE